MDLGRLIWYLDLAALLLVILKLLKLGLNRIYPWLFLYLLFDLLESIAGFTAPRSGAAYFDIYLMGQSLKLFAAVGLVLELFRVALTVHPALARFGQRAAGYLLIAASAIGIAVSTLNAHVPPGRSPLLYRFFLFERAFAASLGVFLVIITAFTTWFPVRMRRNVTLYIYGFLWYFSARFAGLLALAILPIDWKPIVDNALLAVPLACLLVWLIGLNKQGEQVTTVVGHRWNPIEAARLSVQLDAINASLVRFVR